MLRRARILGSVLAAALAGGGLALSLAWAPPARPGAVEDNAAIRTEAAFPARHLLGRDIARDIRSAHALFAVTTHPGAAPSAPADRGAQAPPPSKTVSEMVAAAHRQFAPEELTRPAARAEPLSLALPRKKPLQPRQADTGTPPVLPAATPAGPAAAPDTTPPAQPASFFARLLPALGLGTSDPEQAGFRLTALDGGDLPSGAAAQDARILAFVEDHYRVTGGPIAEAEKFAARAYAPNVRFYGKDLARAEVLAEMRRFAQRWPVRDYRVRPETALVKCDAARASCRVDATIDYRTENPERGAVASGVTTHSLMLTMTRGGPVIVEESGKIIRPAR